MGVRAIVNALSAMLDDDPLAVMSRDQWAVLLLVDAQGLTYRETAECLEIPVGTVRSRLSTARRKVAAAVGVGVPATSIQVGNR